MSVGARGETTPGNLWWGSIDEFRLSVGKARWTAAFTPPTVAYHRSWILGVPAPAAAPTFSIAGGASTTNRTSAYVSVGAAYALNAKVSLVAEYENFDKVAKDGDSHIKADLLSVGIRYAF